VAGHVGGLGILAHVSVEQKFRSGRQFDEQIQSKAGRILSEIKLNSVLYTTDVGLLIKRSRVISDAFMT
jgi:hypothetical protein